jgi:hypothetical protein
MSLFAESIQIIISALISSFASNCQVFINAFIFSRATENSLYVFSAQILSIIKSRILFNATSIKLELSQLTNITQSRLSSKDMFFFFIMLFFSTSTFLELISSIKLKGVS